MATTDRTLPPRKDEYLQARVSREDKKRIEMAARLAGLDVSVYIRLHVLKAAKRDLENQAQENRILLSGKEWDQFMKIMEAPPQLNDNLRRAFRDFQKKYG
jgi:uncharacterized protein (DUF1778 family)